MDRSAVAANIECRNVASYVYQAQRLFYSAFFQTVNLRGHDEITFGQAIDLVSPQGNFRFSPGQQNVGVMPLRLSHRARSIYKIQRLLEIRKRETACNVVLVDDLPLRHLLVK